MNRELYRIIVDELGKSRPTASSWIANNSYPAEACLLIEQLTDGGITAQSLRPDLFLPNASDKQLSNVIKNLSNVDEPTTYLITGILNYFEAQHPELHDDIVASLKETEFGKDYLTQRTLYTNEKL